MNTNVVSWFAHAGLAALWTALVAAATGNVFAGALSAGLFFLAREVTQRQYVIRTETGVTLKQQPLHAGFDVHNWTPDAQMDALFAFVGAGIVWAAWGLLPPRLAA